MHRLKTNILNKKLIALCLLSFGLVACSSTDDEEEVNAMAELTEINQQFSPQVTWSKDVGNGVDDYYSKLTPIVAYDKVFSASRDGDAVAFDAQTGKQVWQIDLRKDNPNGGFMAAKTPALLSGGPVAGINRVFIGTENGELYALSADTGEVAWTGKVKGEIITKPALDAGVIVVNTASGILKAFNASNGEEMWKIEQDVPPLTLRGISAPVIASGGVLTGAPNGSLHVTLLENGQRGWSSDIGEATGSTELERVIDVDATPLVYGDKVYAISARGSLVALDLRSGRVLWKRQYSSYEDMTVSGNTIFFTDVKGHVYAIDRLNGLEQWSQLSLTNRKVTGPAVVKDYVVVGDTEGYLHWLNKETGEFVARKQLDSSGIHSAPTVANDILYVQTRDGELQAVTTP